MHSIHVSHCYCGCLVAVIVASVSYSEHFGRSVWAERGREEGVQKGLQMSGT